MHPCLLSRRYSTIYCKMKLLILAVATFTLQVAGECSEPRVRYSYDELKKRGRTQVYFDAIQEAVENGMLKSFSDAHVKQMSSEAHAHRKGTFLTWHRVFLLAFENMLRSLGPKYECVTLPYWNYYSENSKLAGSNGGQTLFDVSQIAKEMPIGLASRSDWASYKSFPAEVSLASSISNLDVDDYEKASKSIESTVHNSVHSWLAGTMRTGQSPLDPVFYSHHSMIDALHFIYYSCKSGPGKNENYRKNNPIAYVPWGGAPKSTDPFVVDATSDIQKYFDDLPQAYFNYFDTEAIPGNAYSYHLDGNFQDEIDNSLTCVAKPVDPTDPPVIDPTSPIPPVVPGVTPAPGATPVPTTDTSADPETPPAATTPTEPPAAPTPEDENMRKFVDSVTGECLALGIDETECKTQAKDIECLCFDEVFGVEDFTEDFRKNFMIPDDEHTECAQAVIDYDAAVASGNVTEMIAVDEEVWKTSCLSHFGKAQLNEEEKKTKNPKKTVVNPPEYNASTASSNAIFSAALLVAFRLYSQL